MKHEVTFHRSQENKGKGRPRAADGNGGLNDCSLASSLARRQRGGEDWRLMLVRSSVSKLAKEAGETGTVNGQKRWERQVRGLGVASKQGIFIIQVLLCLEFRIWPVLVILGIVLFNLENALKEDFD